MARFGTDTPITSTFKFSAVDLSTLGSSEYTIVRIAVDRSGSTAGFERDEESCLKSVVEACRKSPRADNLLLSLTKFNHALDEVHGFKTLQDCAPADYDNILDAAGGTALYDAAVNAIDAVAEQGKILIANDYSANGIVFVITDGMNYGGIYTAPEVKKAQARARVSENLESLVTILIGVNVKDAQVAQYLAALAKDGDFTQYVELADADPKTLARLAAFISKSISSQSQAMGTGGVSQHLPTF